MHIQDFINKCTQVVERFITDFGMDLSAEELESSLLELLQELSDTLKTGEGLRAGAGHLVGEAITLVAKLIVIQNTLYETDRSRSDSHMKVLREIIKSHAGFVVDLQNKIENFYFELSKLNELNLTEQDELLFFLGAGASKPSPSSIPTLSEMLPHLWEESHKMVPNPLEKIETLCRQNNIWNIEEMLTALTISIFVVESPKIAGLLNSILYHEDQTSDFSTDEINSVRLLDNILKTIFSLLVGTMLGAKPNKIHNFLATFLKGNENVGIITTNYDVCLEQALEEQHITYDYILNRNKTTDLTIIKMHGSINGFYCDNCQNVSFPSIDVLIRSTSEGMPYPINGICKVCQGVTRQFIIPPVSHKYLTHPPIVQIWEEGRKKIESARALIVIGYSFADADDYIAKMLVNAMRKDKNKIIIFANADSNSIIKFRDYLGSHVKGFDIHRQFFGLMGDATEMIPILVRLLEKRKSRSTGASQ